MANFLDEIEACIPALRRYARALTHDRDLADDLVQDCLERAVRKRALWRPTGPVRAWLFRILLNLYRDELRRNRTRPSAVAIDDLSIEPGTPETQQSHLEFREAAAALQRLPAEQREALLLIALEGMSYAEAAQTLEIPQGTLVSRIGRARKALRSLNDPAAPRLRTVK